jgi:hypothetical protein
MTTALPQAIEDIDAAFMTTALATGHPGTRVAAVEVTSLRQGSASSLTLALVYDRNPAGLPPTMFLKGDFIDHEFTSPVAFFAEAQFFADIAPLLPDGARVPTCFFAGVDEDAQAIVVLEDLAGEQRGSSVRFGDAEAPYTVEEVASGIEQLAVLHGRFWGGRGTGSADWLASSDGVAMLMRYLVQPEHFDDYIALERAADLPARLKDRAQVEKAVMGMFEADRTRPQTLIHGDPHIGNTWVEDGQIGFFDWQGVALGPAVWDATYFLTGALEVEDRRRAERDLLDLYRDRLAATGVEGPSRDDLWLAHRQHMMHGYLSILTPVEMQPDSFAVTVGGRFAQAAEDLDTLRSSG